MEIKYSKKINSKILIFSTSSDYLRRCFGLPAIVWSQRRAFLQSIDLREGRQLDGTRGGHNRSWRRSSSRLVLVSFDRRQARTKNYSAFLSCWHDGQFGCLGTLLLARLNWCANCKRYHVAADRFVGRFHDCLLRWLWTTAMGCSW